MISITTKTMHNPLRPIGIALFSLVLAACGDSGTATSIPAQPPVVQATTGYVVDAPVTDATCTVHAIVDGVADASALASATSNAGVLDFGSVELTRAALLACTGGTFTDEATGETLSAPNMSAVVDFAPGGSYVISLLTEIATRLAEAQGDLSTALTTYNTAVADSFGLEGVEITTQIPTDLNVEPAADDDAGKYGTALLLLAQMVADASIAATRDEALTVLTDDLADDGQMSAITVAALDQAAANFAAGDAPAKANMNMDVASVVIKSSGIGARPVADAGVDQSVAAGVLVTLNGTGADEDGSVVSFKWQQLTGASVTLDGGDTATPTFTSPSLDVASTLEFELTVTDDQGGVAFDVVYVAVAAKPVPEKSNQDALNAGADQSKSFGDAAFTQAATGGSGSGALSYVSSNTGVATVNANGEVTIVGGGSAVITATKAADAVYNAATDSFVVTVAKANQVVLATGVNLSKTYGDAPFRRLTRGGSSSGPVTYASSNTSVATVTASGLITIVGSGSTVITVTKAGDSNFNAVTDSYTLTVAKAAQAALNAGADVAKTYGDAAFTQAATGGSGNGAVVYTSSATSVATVTSAGVVTVVGVGSATITATKAADANYNAATDSYTLTVSKADQAALNAGADVAKTYGDAAFTQAATGGSGTGAVTYASSNTSVATVDANGVVTLGAPGTATITASKAADDDYLAASDSYTVTVAKAEQASFSAGSDIAKAVGDGSYTQAATGGSGSGAVTYASSDTGVATIDGSGLATFVAVGTTTITATKAADANYNEASDSYTLTVTPLTISNVAVTSGSTIVQDDSTSLATNASSVLGSAVAGKTFTVTGTGFGNSAGSIVFQSDVAGSAITATVSSWSDTSIVVVSPAVTLNTAGAPEAFKVRVTNAGDSVSTSAAFTYDDCDTCRLNDGCPF